MDNKHLIERILDNIESIKNSLFDMKVVQAKQEANLAEHMRRTDQNEEAIILMRKELEPLKRKSMYIDMFLKVCGGIGISVSCMIGVAKAILFLRSLHLF